MRRLSHSDRDTKSQKVLTAAAMTYVAAVAMAAAQLLRLLALRGASDER